MVQTFVFPSKSNHLRPISGASVATGNPGLIDSRTLGRLNPTVKGGKVRWHRQLDMKQHFTIAWINDRLALQGKKLHFPPPTDQQAELAAPHGRCPVC